MRCVGSTINSRRYVRAGTASEQQGGSSLRGMVKAYAGGDERKGGFVTSFRYTRDATRRERPDLGRGRSQPPPVSSSSHEASLFLLSLHFLPPLVLFTLLGKLPLRHTRSIIQRQHFYPCRDSARFFRSSRRRTTYARG